MELDEEFADPANAQRLRDAYTGRHDVTDAIWWRSHPLEPGPSGAVSPAAQAARLARLVFSRDGADSATVVAHAAAESQLESDRRDIDEAIARARESAQVLALEQATALAQAQLDVNLDLDGGAGELGPADETEQRENAPVRWSVKRIVIVAAVAVVVAAGVGVWAGMRIPVAAPAQQRDIGAFGYDPFAPKVLPSSPSPSPTASSAPAVSVFDRPQVISDSAAKSDLPELVVPTDQYTLTSFRLIDTVFTFPSGAESSADPNAAGPVAAVYAVRTTSNRVCALAVKKKRIIGASCVVEAEFPLNGIELTFPVGRVLYTVSMQSDGTTRGLETTDG